MRRQRLILVSLWLLLLANYLDRMAISFAGPAIMKSLSMNPRDFGVVLSSFGVGFLLAQIPGGLLSDRMGARPVFVIGALLWALFTGMMGLVSTVTAFVVVRFLFGLSEGATISSFYKAIGDYFPPEERAKASSMSMSAIAIAPACAGPLVGMLVAHAGWQGMFLWMMIPALIASLAAYLFLPRKTPDMAANREAVREDAGPYIDILKMPSLWLFSLAAICWNIPYWGYLGWMPSYLAMARDIDLKVLGTVASIPYVFAFVGIIIFGRLGSRFPRYCGYIVAGCFGGAAVALMAAYQVHSATSAVACLAATAFFLFGIHGPLAKVALDVAPQRQRAAFVSTYLTVGHVSSAATPAVIGFLVSKSGTFGGGFAMMIVALALAAFCLIALSRMAQANAEVALAQD